MSDKERMRWKEICVGWYMASENTEPKYRDLNLRPTLIDLLIRWEWRQSRIYRKKELLKKKPLYWFENVLFCLDWIGCVRSVAVLAGNNERDVFSVGHVNYHHPLHQPTHFFIIPNNTLCHPWWFWRYICQPSYEQKTFSSVILSKRFWSQWNNTSSCIPLHKFVNEIL